jgi:hypothetical protein
MWQIGLNFHNGFALALPRRAILAFRSIPAVDARIVAIARLRVSPLTANHPRNASAKLLAFATSAPQMERATPRTTTDNYPHFTGFSHLVAWPETVHTVPALHRSEGTKRSASHFKSDFLSALQAMWPLSPLSQMSPSWATV